jgi:branched-chain amino acid aminotransferase
MQIFINDNIFPENIPLIYANDRGLLLGDGLFETIKTMKGIPLHFEQHYKRLSNSASAFSIPLSYNASDLLMICKNLIKINKLHDTLASIRITLTRGRSVRGIAIPEECSPTLLITTAPYQPQTQLYPKACITNIKRNEYSEFTRHKTIQYLEFIFARKLAKEQGFDEGILLNTKGAITETSIANIFFVLDEKVYTPKIEDGALPGITREIIIKCCHNIGMPLSEEEIFPEKVLQATEAFQTNSLLDIQMLSFLNNSSLKYGEKAKVTNAIMTEYAKYQQKIFPCIS